MTLKKLLVVSFIPFCLGTSAIAQDALLKAIQGDKTLQSAQSSQPDTPKDTSLLHAEDPQSIVDYMKTAGYKAELGQDDDGDPIIASKIDNINFSIYFYGCTKGKSCDSIEFGTSFDTRDGITLESVNRWNRENRFTNVYLDEEKDPFIEMDIIFKGGQSTETFKENLETWESLLGDFQRHINW